MSAHQDIENTINTVNNLGVSDARFKEIAASLIASIIAQTCTDYFKDARELMLGESKYQMSTLQRKVDEYRAWFLEPDSDYNTVYRHLYELAIDGEIGNRSMLNGQAMVDRLEAMVHDTDTYPNNYFDFVSHTHI